MFCSFKINKKDNLEYYSFTQLNNVLYRGEVVYNIETKQCYYYDGEKLILLGDNYESKL